jgi:hypothetical protein
MKQYFKSLVSRKIFNNTMEFSDSLSWGEVTGRIRKAIRVGKTFLIIK